MVNINNLFSRIDGLGLTAYRVAQDTNIDKSNFTYWRNGRSAPSLEKMVALANYLDCSLDYLLGRTDDPSIRKRVG